MTETKFTSEMLTVLEKVQHYLHNPAEYETKDCRDSWKNEVFIIRDQLDAVIAKVKETTSNP